MPLEQYFTSDYRELIRDERDNVLDAFTQLPPHLAQTGQLVDLIGNSHPEECQADKVMRWLEFWWKIRRERFV